LKVCGKSSKSKKNMLLNISEICIENSTLNGKTKKFIFLILKVLIVSPSHNLYQILCLAS
jgi:hypothetical protein